MPLSSLFRPRPSRRAAAAAYGAIVARARTPHFFAAWGVPDTLDGRFEMLALHGFLVLRRLKGEGPAAAAFAQALFDTMFADMDRSLREMGASDVGVGRHVKAMARAFYGRLEAYERGLDGAEPLDGALARNLYGTAPAPPERIAAVAAYLRRQQAALAAVPAARLLAGEVPFAPLADT